MKKREKLKSMKAKKSMGTKEERIIVLLDVHAILHRAFHALPDFSTSKGEPTGALYGLSSMLIKIIGDLKPDYIVAAYDLPGPTYRHEVFEDYKAKRPKLDDVLAIQIERSRDIFKAFNVSIFEHSGFEADDIIGTLVESLRKNEELNIIIASGDMDTLQLVDGNRVRVYTLRKGLSDTILYNETRVEERYGFPPSLLSDFKGLRGDPSDNIPGVRGVGEKTATVLVQKFGTIENLYKTLKKNREELEKAGVSERIVKLLEDNEEEAVFSKMLATIRRDAPIKFSLPEKEWRLSVKLDDVDSLFLDLEFRTLGTRFKEVLKRMEVTSSGVVANGSNTLPPKGVSDQELEELKIALWLINSNLTNPTPDDILRFTRAGNFKTARGIILGEIKKRNLTFVFEEIEKPLISIIEKMEKRGVKVNRSYIEKLSKDYHSELKRREKNIWREAGEEFNINSPQQLAHILFDKLGLKPKSQKRTPTGMRSTRESELEKMNESHPIIGHVLEYREFAKLLSTYIDNIPKMLDKNDRLHTSLRQAGTTTGRMSSNNPNLQNIPIRTELGRNIRRAFVAEKNFKLLSFDYSQIELRVAAILSGDEKLLDIFRKGEDVHSSVASHVFGVPIGNVDAEMRRRAKIINFGILYGMGVNALRQNLGTSRDEAQKFYNDYFKTFSSLARYLEKIKSDAERKGYTETLFGRRRYFEGLKSKMLQIKAAAERMAINAPFQGTAADIIKLAMQQISEVIKKRDWSERVFMILQVHDELLFEVLNEHVYEAAEVIREVMESILPPDRSLGVVCVAHGSIGENWAEMEALGAQKSVK